MGDDRARFRRPDPDIAAAVRSVERMAELMRAKRDERRRATAASTAGDGAGRPLAFLHVPKSAGSSLVAALHAALPEHRWAPWTFDRSLMGPFRDVPTPSPLAARVLPSPASLAGYDAAAGHLSLPTLRHRFAPIDVAIVLREPRSRLLSLYEFWRNLPDEVHDEHRPWTSMRTAVDLDVDAWLDDPSIAFQTDNSLIRQLVPDDDLIPPDDFIPPDVLDRLARRAVEALRTVGWVGLVELGDATWESLGERVGADLTPARLNVTGRRAGRATALGPLFSEAATRSLAARVAGDRLVWRAVALRLGVDDPDVLAEVAWAARLAQVVERRSEPAHTSATAGTQDVGDAGVTGDTEADESPLVP